jgi:hypothetical protein
VRDELATRILIEHDRLIPIKEHPIFEVPPNRPRENNFFQVAPFLNQILNGIAV